MVSMLSFSEAGGHPANEDAFTVRRHPADADCWLCFLADGQGGRAGGARAAQLACHRAADAALLQPRGKLAVPSAWAAILECADAAVCSDPEAGFTTLLGFCLADGYLVGASCGDSAVLAWTAGDRPKEVTAGQAKNPPVGSGAARFAPFGAVLVAPWSVLACSDGVWKYAGWERLVELVTVARGQPLVEQIQDAARLRGSGRFPDDFTLVLFQEESAPTAVPGRGTPNGQ